MSVDASLSFASAGASVSVLEFRRVCNDMNDAGERRRYAQKKNTWLSNFFFSFFGDFVSIRLASDRDRVSPSSAERRMSSPGAVVESAVGQWPLRPPAALAARLPGIRSAAGRRLLLLRRLRLLLPS